MKDGIEFSRRAFIGTIAAMIATPKNVFSLPIESAFLPEVPQQLAQLCIGHVQNRHPDEDWSKLSPEFQIHFPPRTSTVIDGGHVDLGRSVEFIPHYRVLRGIDRRGGAQIIVYGDDAAIIHAQAHNWLQCHCEFEYVGRVLGHWVTYYSELQRVKHIQVSAHMTYSEGSKIGMRIEVYNDGTRYRIVRDYEESHASPSMTKRANGLYLPTCLENS